MTARIGPTVRGATLALLLAGTAAWGQTPPAPAEPGQEIVFSANLLDYDDDAQLVTASGDVIATRNGQRLRADRVIWHRDTGQMRAEGDVILVNPNGDRVYGDDIELTDDMKDGIAHDLLIVLDSGGRIAADSGTRTDGVTVARHAAYSPCAVVDGGGCPKTPLWSITADTITHDPTRHRIFYRHAQLRLLGRPIVWLPRFSHPDGSQGGNESGLLVPQTGYARQTGFSVGLPVYFDLAPDRDLTVTPTIFTDALPMVAATYRKLSADGAYQGSLYLTGDKPFAGDVDTPSNGRVRGYLTANGRWQLDPSWTLDASIRAVTDKSFLRRYEISGDDRLRSTVSAERIASDSYLAISGWFTQTLRVGQSTAGQPIALPLIEYRRRIADPLLGGTIEIDANTLALTRREGQDTQRAFVGARWDLRTLTPFGQELTLTALVRGDLYHASDLTADPLDIYRGRSGWSTRGIAAGVADLRWPFVGALAGGTQMIAPRVQLVLTPRTPNRLIPNEDSRAVDLESSNLFAIDRFSGYDRWEDSSRVTYGADWRYDRARLAVSGQIGQSYRLDDRGDIFLPGTGLNGRFSDIVARGTVRYAGFVSVTERLRIDKDSLEIRRNEVDLTLGSKSDYITIGYFKLNRNIVANADDGIDDLADHEDLRVSARLQLAKHWSAYGSAIVDLTSRSEEPTAATDGFQPVRQRIGLQYLDECFRASIAFQRTYDTTGASSGNAILVSVNLLNLGS